MKAYQLEGLLEPNQQKNPLCPTIKNNCCTPGDILKVHDKYNNNLKPKLLESRDKFTSELRQLRKLHHHILRLTERQNLRGNQQLFCASTFKNVTDFDFMGMMEDLQTGHAMAFDFFQKVHTGFMCVFCDFEAHSEIMLSTRSVGIDSGVCLDALNSLKDFLITQNIRLVQYFRTLQRFLDCSLFDDKFNLPFTFGQQDILRITFRECFKKLTPDSLDPLCLPLCDQLQFGAISPVFEGHTFFINRAINYFQDQIRAIIHKVNNTAFDPLQALQQLNMARERIAFSEFRNKTEERMKFMDSRHNQWDQGSYGNVYWPDNTFRNDLTPYPSTDKQDNMDKIAEMDPEMFSQLNREGWDKYYRDVFNPTRPPQFLRNQGVRGVGSQQGQQGQQGWQGQQGQQGWQGQQGQQGWQGQQNMGGVGGVSSFIGGGIGNAAADRNRATGNFGAAGVSLLSGLNQRWRSRVLKKGNKNAEGVRKTKSLESKKSSTAQKVHHQKAKRKMKHGAAHADQKKAKRKASQKTKPKFFITGDKTASKKGKKKASKKSEAKGPTAADVLEKDAIKTLLGKTDVPAKEEKLLEKMAKIIDTEFESKMAEKKAARKASKRHLRVLEEMLGDSPAFGISNGRILQTQTQAQAQTQPQNPGQNQQLNMDVDPRMVNNPILYFTAYYDSIDFYPNSTSMEIFKCDSNPPDLPELERTYVFNQGVDIQDYLQNLGFDQTRAALTLKLRGQSNADTPDPMMQAILAASGPALTMAVTMGLSKEYVFVVNPEYMSESDKDLLKVQPQYDDCESFDVINKRYFSDDFIFHLREHLPHSFLRRKPMSTHSPRFLSEVPSSSPVSAEIVRELKQSIRPAQLVSDRRPRKDLF